MERGRDALLDRERSGVRRTESGARGSEGVLISGSSSRPGENNGKESIDAGVSGAENARGVASTGSSHRSPIGASSRDAAFNDSSAGSFAGATSSEKS